MSEITRITTIQITEILKNQADLQDKTEYGKELAEEYNNESVNNNDLAR